MDVVWADRRPEHVCGEDAAVAFHGAMLTPDSTAGPPLS